MAATTAKKTTETVKEEKRVFKNEDMIPCRSIVAGGLLIEGPKSGTLYQWSDYGDVEDVEYRDISQMAQRNDPWTFKPAFVVEDDDFIAKFPKLKKLYDNLYKQGDLAEILNLSVSQMKREIEKLPSGAKDSIKNIAAGMIANGTLDSVSKIKAIDEIFDTNYLYSLVEN